MSQPVRSPAAAASSTPCRRGASGDQQVDDVGHAEHRGVQQSSALGHTTGVEGRARLQVGAGLDESPGNLGVAVAGSGDQRCLPVANLAVDWRPAARSNQATAPVPTTSRQI